MNVNEWLGEDNQIGIDIWEKKYRYSNESFDEWLDRVSRGNDELRELIKDKKFLFAGRILSNRGLQKDGKKITYSNCYVVAPPEDSIESIFNCAKKLARTFSYGGGCGVDISKLAPKGARVNNAAKKTSGAISFMDLYSLTTELIGQNGRRGALMISIDCHHPDVQDFIEIKSDLDKVTKANISIRVTKDFMDAVINDEDFKLEFVREETGEKITKIVKAGEIFDKFAYMDWDYAEPSFLFWDRIKEWNLLSNTKEFEYAGTNPCVSGDTLILTDGGYKRIDSLVDKPIKIWNGYEWSKVIPLITGYNQPMKRVHLSDGSQIDCTNYHKFVLRDKSRVEAKDLNVGGKLIKYDFPLIDGCNIIDEKTAYTQGFFMGDGSIATTRNRLTINLHKDKRKLINKLHYKNCVYCPSFDGESLTLPYEPQKYTKDFVPDASYNIESRLNWLAGYIDSDGTLQSIDGGLSISCINKDVLTRVKYLLNTLGCNGTINVMREEEDKPLPTNDGTENTKIYHCKKCYRITISATNVKKLVDLGLNTHRVPLVANPNRDASRYIQIVNIETIPDCDVVYCFNEPFNHTAIFNGVMTAQCAEEPLPAGGSCLLGSINLSEFIENPFTNKARFNFESFDKTICIAIKALNDVLDEGLSLHPLEEQQQSVRDWRQIGLGIMGLADMLIKMEIVYGSKESLDLCNEISKTMIDRAIYYSSQFAQVKRHPFPKYNKDDIMSTNFFMENTTAETKQSVSLHGLINSQLLTIAPTGTLSTMLGISGGLEPVFSNYYTRKTESLHGEDKYYKIFTPIAKKYLERNGFNEDETLLPKYFITSQEIPYEQRIEMQGVWQQHIDASISSTINLSNSTTVDDVKEIYILAYKKGLKGITIFRDGCKRQGILTTEPQPENQSPSTDLSTAKLPRGYIISPADKGVGLNTVIHSGCGKFYLNAKFDLSDGEPYEIFINNGSEGGCRCNLEGNTRLASLALRGGVYREDVIDQLKSIKGCAAYRARTITHEDTSKGTSCPSAIGYALEELCQDYKDLFEDDSDDSNLNEDLSNDSEAIDKVVRDIISDSNDDTVCPDCGDKVQIEGGCVICHSCGWSRCE